MSKVYVYCPQPSASARVLTRGLKEAGVDAKRVRSMRRPPRMHIEDSKVLCWGSKWDGAVNSAQPINKLQELEVLSAAGVYVPPFQRCGAAPGGLFLAEGYLLRNLRHSCGTDLLNGEGNPNRTDSHFWTKRMDVVREYRVHVVDGKSIRVGVKRVRPGYEVENPNPDIGAVERTLAHHPWIRSYAAGWGIYYDSQAREGFDGRGRELAKRAVDALGLKIGAVDLWKLQDGAWCVGEVNRRPGMDEGSGLLGAYVKAVSRLMGVAT